MSNGLYGNAWIRELDPTPHYRLSGWIGADRALGWIAFGKALPVEFWDFYFYLGASEWLRWPPELLARRLERAERGEVLGAPGIGEHLLNHLQGEADEHVGLAIEAAERRADAERVRQLMEIPSPPEPEHLGPTAGVSAGQIRASLVDCERQHAAILHASDTLRRVLAAGDLAAFGRAGDATNPPERLAAKPRDRVPCTIFRAPVTVACEGVFPWLRPVDSVHRKGASARLLYRDLAFAAEDVLQLWPGGGSGM